MRIPNDCAGRVRVNSHGRQRVRLLPKLIEMCVVLPDCLKARIHGQRHSPKMIVAIGRCDPIILDSGIAETDYGVCRTQPRPQFSVGVWPSPGKGRNALVSQPAFAFG